MAVGMDVQKQGFVPQDRRDRCQVLSLRGIGWASGLLSIGAFVMAAIPAGPAMAQEGKSKRMLQQPVDIESLQTRSKVEMELDGEMRLEDRSAKQTGGVKAAPVKAKASQDYFEAVAFEHGMPVAAARQFITANLENWVSGKSFVQTLRNDCRDTRMVEHQNTWEQFCPSVPLDRKEVELLRSPINTVMLERLLPKQPAKANSEWIITEDDARLLLNLDAVNRSDLRAKILSVDSGVAKIDLRGGLEGTADSVSTEIQVRGTAHVKIGTQGAMVHWLGVSIQESRQISKLRPGFSITARIQLIREEQPQMQLVERKELLKLAASDDPSRWLVRMESSLGKHAMYADRNWVTYVDGAEDSVMKLIENNQAIAQCNIGQLPRMEPGSHLTAEGLEADIRAALKERFEELLETTEKVTASGLRLLRMEVSGTQEQIPIRWIYAHLSDDSGRRAALVFTLAAEYAEQFAGNDLQILDNFQFTPSGLDDASTSGQADKKSAQTKSPAKR